MINIYFKNVPDIFALFDFVHSIVILFLILYMYIILLNLVIVQNVKLIIRKIYALLTRKKYIRYKNRIFFIFDKDICLSL